jgi:hypothetical protein
MTQRRLSRLTITSIALAAAALGSSCSSAGDAREDLGTAAILLSQAPESVRCIRVVIESSSVQERTFDVTPGQATVLDLNRLPFGLVNFAAEAFDAACSAIGDPNEIPSWISDVVPADIRPGRRTQVLLSMHPNGRSTINIDFPPVDVAMCSPALKACSAASECCSQTCEGGKCCKALNKETCISDAECCSGHCNVNSPRTCCQSDGAACSDAQECCTGACHNGTCGQCKDQGFQCAANAECCDGLICSNGSCLTPPPCAAFGAACSSSSDCCHGACQQGLCACLASGQPCDERSDCCSVVCTNAGFCQ